MEDILTRGGFYFSEGFLSLKCNQQKFRIGYAHISIRIYFSINFWYCLLYSWHGWPTQVYVTVTYISEVSLRHIIEVSKWQAE